MARARRLSALIAVALLGRAGVARADDPPAEAQKKPPAEAKAASDKPADAKPEEPPPPIQVDVRGRVSPPSRGASDFVLRVGALGNVPRQNAAELLKLAPGILLTNEGGDGHAAQVFMRGFDARFGQDVEFSVNGIPFNEVANPKGNGYADPGFIIPEVVERLRVLEGPFDPHQGNFAVAGGADYELGLTRRGVTAKYQVGSFDTHRLVATWGPNGESTHTFGAAELFTTSGFGRNRDGQRASAIAQYEGKLGKAGTFRLFASGHLARFHSAGVLRDDDVRAERVDFFGTMDPRQGSDSMRFLLGGDLEAKAGATLFRQSVWVGYRDLRNRENFTGFLLDPQEPQQKPHGQRGDLLDTAYGVATFGGRGSARFQTQLFGQRQEVELGYFARGDVSRATQLRVEAATNAPYRRELDLESTTGDFGLFADASLKPVSWLTVRGGLRADLFTFDVLDKCAVQSVRQPSSDAPPGDASCLSQQDFGRYREPDQRVTTASVAFLPRGTLLLGPFRHFTLSVSVGQGVRSIDPSYVTDDLKTPFAGVTAGEVGVGYAGGVGDVELVVRSIFFHTWVERDLVFSESAGRAILGGASLRTGWAGAVRATGRFFDVSTNLTLVRARFEDDGLAIPYVPGAVLRTDASGFGELPIPAVLKRRWRAAGAVGLTYVSPRALPYGQRSDDIFTLDTSLTLSWGELELGGIITNLLDTQYRLGEYNYASDFHSAAAPTLVPTRHFAAGPPRAFYLVVSGTLGGEP